jgi:hypothetical protein
LPYIASVYSFHTPSRSKVTGVMAMPAADTVEAVFGHPFDIVRSDAELESDVVRPIFSREIQ